MTSLSTSIGPVPCATHPSVETALRCGKCEKPICPKCLVYTPVGARCSECAQVRRLPVYSRGAEHYVRAGLAGIAAAFAIGLIWGVTLSLPFFGGFFGLIIAGVAGYLIGEVVSRSINRKMGRPFEIIAGVSTLLALLNAYVLPRLIGALLSGLVLPPGVIVLAYVRAFEGILSVFGLIALLIAVVVAVSRLR